MIVLPNVIVDVLIPFAMLFTGLALAVLSIRSVQK